ncbi:MAG: hypothetical protein ISQ70_13730, partial [Pirellulales bacterium]|nr:hypothetical protein [Pirellulales bacterium]
MPASDISIEQTYRNAIDAMPPAERVARGQAVFNWGRECVARQIAAEHRAGSGG